MIKVSFLRKLLVWDYLLLFSDFFCVWFTVKTSHWTKGHMQISFTITVLYSNLSLWAAELHVMHKSDRAAVSLVPLPVSLHLWVRPLRSRPTTSPLSVPSGWKCLVWASSLLPCWARAIFYCGLPWRLLSGLQPDQEKEREKEREKRLVRAIPGNGVTSSVGANNFLSRATWKCARALGTPLVRKPIRNDFPISIRG